MANNWTKSAESRQNRPVAFSTVFLYGQMTNQHMTMKTWEKTREENLVRHKSSR
jgi:hypothetical protein